MGNNISNVCSIAKWVWNKSTNTCIQVLVKHLTGFDFNTHLPPSYSVEFYSIIVVEIVIATSDICMKHFSLYSYKWQQSSAR